MFAIVIAAALTQLPADDESQPTPRKESANSFKDTPVKWPVAEKITAELLRGIPHKTRKHGDKIAHSRVWTKRELRATFGDPSEVNDTRTLWTWKRSDGIAIAEFQTKGYGNSGDTETLRLQIYSAHFQPPQGSQLSPPSH